MKILTDIELEELISNEINKRQIVKEYGMDIANIMYGFILSLYGVVVSFSTFLLCIKLSPGWFLMMPLIIIPLAMVLVHFIQFGVRDN